MDCRLRFRRLGGRSLRLVDAVGAGAGSSGVSLCPNRRNLRLVLPVPESETLPSGVERRLLLHHTTQRRPQPPPQPATSFSPAAGASLGARSSASHVTPSSDHAMLYFMRGRIRSGCLAGYMDPWSTSSNDGNRGVPQLRRPTCRSLCPGRSQCRCLAACPPRCPSPARSGGSPPGGRRAGRRLGCGAHCSAAATPQPLIPRFAKAAAAVPPAAWAEGS